MSKNKSLAVFLSVVPGLGHIYLGLYKKAVVICSVFLMVAFLYVVFILPFFQDFIKKISLTTVLLNILNSIITLPLFIVYFFSMIDSYYQTDVINQDNSPYKPIKITFSKNK